MSTNILYCSFCGKSQDEVAKLIAGPQVFICDECTRVAMQIIIEGDAGEAEYRSWESPCIWENPCA